MSKAKEFAMELQRLEDLGVAAKSGTSIHIWLSFSEFVTWSKDGKSSSFTVGNIEADLVKACSDLVQEAGVPVFVSLCSCSKFFHAEEMNMENSVGQKLASSLAKSGVPTTSNQLFWSECSNFIDGNLRAIRPTSSNPEPVENKDWDFNAAFACVDKFLFREKMLYACVVSDSTIEEIELNLSEIPLDAVLAEPPSEFSFVGPIQECDRIPIERLRRNRTADTMTDIDFDAVNPKPMFKEERMWYTVNDMTSTANDEYHQEDSSKMHLCAACSRDRINGRKYDEREDNATHCPNCASNFCRKFYFGERDPERADQVLRWAASVIINEKNVSPHWGAMKPSTNMREWMLATIKVFRSHHTGIGKYVSHFGTTRMGFKNAANAMYQGQGKQLNVDRHQAKGPDGRTVDYYQFSCDHGNRMYSDYMRMLFTNEEIASFIGHDDPKEEALGDCIEICLGILRVALMYEDCGTDLFEWGNTMEILTSLELSLLVFNASAYPSGLKNRKINNKRGKGSYTYNDCLDLQVDGIPNRKFPMVIDGLEVPDDAEMDVATGYRSSVWWPICSVRGRRIEEKKTDAPKPGKRMVRGCNERNHETHHIQRSMRKLP